MAKKQAEKCGVIFQSHVGQWYLCQATKHHSGSHWDAWRNAKPPTSENDLVAATPEQVAEHKAFEVECEKRRRERMAQDAAEKLEDAARTLERAVALIRRRAQEFRDGKTGNGSACPRVRAVASAMHEAAWMHANAVSSIENALDYAAELDKASS